MQTVTHNTDNYFLHTPSRVEFGVGSKGPQVVLDDKWTMHFDSRSQIAGQMALGVNTNHLKQQFTDGSFFIVDDKIIDYRLKQDLKFVHTDDAIVNLANTLGFAKQLRTRAGLVSDDLAASTFGDVLARSQTEKFECNATDSIGGQFDIKIGFSWSPYGLDINSYIEMWRQVCDNGAIAQSPLMNHRIPMLNKWEENLAISNQVIRHSFDKVVMPRLAALPDERISMADLNILLRIVSDQASSTHQSGESLSKLYTIQEKLESAWDPQAAGLKSNILKFISAPVTAFDAMNIATEISTHHVARDRTGARAQAFVNGIIFDDKRQRNLAVNLDTLIIDSETFDQVDQAFFGVTCH